MANNENAFKWNGILCSPEKMPTTCPELQEYLYRPQIFFKVRQQYCVMLKKQVIKQYGSEKVIYVHQRSE